MSPVLPPTRHRGRFLITLPVLGLAGVLAASCGIFGKDDEEQADLPEYYHAVETDPLQIPDGLERPTSSTALVILAPPAPLPQKELKTVPPRVTSTSGGDSSRTLIRWGSEGAYLLVEDTLESVQRRLRLVIERSGMSLDELDGAEGYRVEYWHQPEEKEGFFSKLAFWRDDGPNYSGVYRVFARPDGEKTRIYVKNEDGSEPDSEASEHLLTILGERLG